MSWFQVYHGRFFDVCKRQKAVKEAVRFTKLIPNPTLSTFNMLMSVCAGAQDTEGTLSLTHTNIKYKKIKDPLDTCQ